MTLVGAFVYQNIPIFIGDILISSDSTNQDEMILPLIGDVQRISGEITYAITDVCRKVQPLSKNAFCLWSGDYIDSRYALSALRDYFSAPAKSTCLPDLLGEFETRDLNIGLILAIRTETSWWLGGYRTPNREISGFERVFLSGTGAERVEDLLNQMNQPIPQFGQPTASETAASIGYGIMAQLIGNEITQGSGLRDRFGGAYEVFSCKGNIAYPLGHALFLHFSIEESKGDHRVDFIPRIYKVETIRDFLLIRSLEFFRLPNGKYKATSDRVHILPPMFYDEYNFPTQQELECLNLKYDWLCSYSIAHYNDGTGALTKVSFEPGLQKSVEVIHENGSWQLGIKKTYINSIIDDFKRR